MTYYNKDMIGCSKDFDMSIELMHRLTSAKPQDKNFNPIEERTQHAVVAALKTLNQASIQGSPAEQNRLYQSWDNIVALNALLASEKFADEVQDRLGIEVTDKSEFEGMQIKLPQTKFQKMIEVVTRIPRAILAIIIDLSLLAPAAILVIIAMCGVKFDPTEPKQDKIPILLIHGNGFNETEWVLGRQFLKKEHYGSVFSLNYDGLLTNDSKMGIDDYAKEKISHKIKEIKKATGQNEIILIGHSMGGLIASQYAENIAVDDKTTIKHIISIATPWQGAPLLNFVPESMISKRLQQMSPHNPWRKNLVENALKSERMGTRKYYHLNSTTDIMAPSPYSNLSEDPRRQYTLSYLGHYGIIGSPHVWWQIRDWLDKAYDQNK